MLCIPFLLRRRSVPAQLLRFAWSGVCLWACLSLTAKAQQVRLPAAKGAVAELSSSGPQKRAGDLYIADGDVRIRYGASDLRADHVEFNEKTSEAVAIGHVVYNFENEHIEAEEAHYNLRTGRGKFLKVQGTIRIVRRPNPTILISQNPLYFEAQEVRREPGDVYLIDQAWITICDPEHPRWQFFARHARIRLNKSVALVNANFRLIHVPLIWLPYATAPAGQKVRQSGFLIPDIGDSSQKGFILGDAFYWAPKPWMDATLGSQYMSKRGASERGVFRAKPFEDTNIEYNYFGVDDRGLPNSAGVRQPQGGEEQRLQIQSKLPDGWRFVTDYNQLSSLTFRLAFSGTFGEAINAEVPSAAFLTKNFSGFSLNLAALSDKNFLTINPQTSVVLRKMPMARFSSVEQNPWAKVPLYFSFDTFAGAEHRADAEINTPLLVSATEFAPKATLPLHAGDWGITSSAAFRTTRWGYSLDNSGPTPIAVAQPITRNTGEFAIELRPPTLERFFDRAARKGKKARRYKHTIEPEMTYRFVTGVNNFANFIRFDADATLTDTNEVEYGVIQRLFVKNGDDQPDQLMSWSVLQKHFFDPTFGGAVVPGVRNVFQTTDAVTPFAFVNGPVHWSPIVSDFKVTPGGRYDFEQILEYDPNLQKISTIGELVKVRPYKEFFATVADFHLQANPVLQPLSNQIRALIGYGNETRKGFNVTAGLSYDILNNTLLSQLVQISYNGGCCGLAVGYQRLALGPVRNENQFRVALIIANIGTFGNLRRQERIF
ncbi:MAG TPA: LPS assembly protein LptD [Candidatus Acidoferrales bacterium]|nr:LPS assembly protein LptD [Candidatus Acidoferrales bacterium]